MTDQKKYAVLKDVQYYHGDVQHTKGWDIKVAHISDETGVTICIGTLKECQDWMSTLDDGKHYLQHGEASYHYRIAEVLDANADYQGWIDTISDWDGCPSEDGSDYDANCQWAEQQAYDNNGVLPVSSILFSLNSHIIDIHIAPAKDGHIILVDLNTQVTE